MISSLSTFLTLITLLNSPHLAQTDRSTQVTVNYNSSTPPSQVSSGLCTSINGPLSIPKANSPCVNFAIDRSGQSFAGGYARGANVVAYVTVTYQTRVADENGTLSIQNSTMTAQFFPKVDTPTMMIIPNSII